MFWSCLLYLYVLGFHDGLLLFELSLAWQYPDIFEDLLLSQEFCFLYGYRLLGPVISILVLVFRVVG